jgi:hypothetical protein
MMKNWKRGNWLVLGLFAFGGLALLGLFLAPRGKFTPPTTQPGTTLQSEI